VSRPQKLGGVRQKKTPRADGSSVGADAGAGAELLLIEVDPSPPKVSEKSKYGFSEPGFFP
jgi:hypothetical protein